MQILLFELHNEKVQKVRLRHSFINIGDNKMNKNIAGIPKSEAVEHEKATERETWSVAQKQARKFLRSTQKRHKSKRTVEKIKADTK